VLGCTLYRKSGSNREQNAGFFENGQAQFKGFQGYSRVVFILSGLSPAAWDAPTEDGSAGLY